MKKLTPKEISALTSKSEQFRYELINKTFDDELRLKITAQEILFKGLIFTRQDPTNLPDSTRRYLDDNPLNVLPNKSVGVYIIWQDTKLLIDEKVLMKAVYIGEGNVKERLNKHHNEKELLSKYGNYFISFYEIDRRVALYIEALFLEHYHFKNNKEHMYGDDELYAIFSEQAVNFGNDNFIDKMTVRNHKYRNLIDIDAENN